MQTEDDWTRTVMDLAGYTGWTLRMHIRDSRESPAEGYPDWTMVSLRHHAVLWLELKRPNGIILPKQAAWNAALREVTEHPRFRAYARIVEPKDFDEVQRIMEGKA